MGLGSANDYCNLTSASCYNSGDWECRRRACQPALYSTSFDLGQRPVTISEHRNLTVQQSGGGGTDSIGVQPGVTEEEARGGEDDERRGGRDGGTEDKELGNYASRRPPVTTPPAAGCVSSATKHCQWQGQQEAKQPGRMGDISGVHEPFPARRPSGQERPLDTEGNLQQPVPS